jgi:hypothetical protein
MRLVGFRSWHKADIESLPLDVRFLRDSRHALLLFDEYSLGAR